MLGKRKSNMRRTPSVSLIGSGSVNGDSSPLPEHPKEKLKFSTVGTSCCSAPRQVIGFHPNPKGFIDEELDLSSGPISPHRPPSQRSSSKSPSGSPRSGLGDLLAGSRPWERKDEGVGLGIVAALSGSQEEVCKYREDGRGYSVPGAPNDGAHGSRKTSPQAHGHMPSVFAPSRASPPIPIHPPSLHSNSGLHSPSRFTDQNCCPTVSFGLGPISYRPESIFPENSNGHQPGVGSRPYSVNGGPWPRYPNAHNEGASVNWSQSADMELDRIEPHCMFNTYAHLMHSARPKAPASPAFSQVFLNSCHLCKRRLPEGRDIYIYRGDAFCSPECRHQQIMNDEQRAEKCAAAVMKVGGGSDARSTTQRSRVMAGGTATAAAA